MTRFLAIILVLFLLSSSSAPTISAHFFPNISAIPPELLKNASSSWDNFQKFAGCRAGNKQDGLGKLKKYFHYFGYIPNSVSNFTDDFDNELESALKTYQQNFNLNVTGQLDEDTLKQMIRPRCGNADIVNGSTTMNSGKTTPSSSSFHTVGHYAFFPGNPRWPSNKRDLTYAFFDSNLTQEAKDVFSRAFARWSTVIPMTFEETDSVAAADIRIGFFSGDHGDGEPFDGVLGTLAHAFSPPSGRFHLDADENWVVTTDYSTSLLSSVASAVDLESVAVHEIGHLLGLGHSSVEGAIMYPTISSGTRKVELAADDITGVQLLYGSNPNYNSSSSATPAANERENNGAYSLVEAGSRWGLASFLAAGFYLLFL